MTKYHQTGKLPPLAGICTFDEAQRQGLSVEECVQRLKCYHYSFKRLHQIFNNRISSEPVYELKMTFSLHAYYCAEHVEALRQRVGEMREPPLGLESVPDKHLEILFDEILVAPTTVELLLGIYETVIPSLRNSMLQHLTDTNPLADHPSVRIIRFALLEIDEMLKIGQATIDELVDTKQRLQSQSWIGLLNQCQTNTEEVDESTIQTVKRQHSVIPYQYDG